MQAITTREYIRNSQYDENIEPDRFTQITGKNNYRSGRIVSQKQLEMLKKKYKIKRVINLAKDSMTKQRDITVPCERECEPEWARRLGLEYYPYYLGSRPPSEQNWAEIKDILRKGNVLVHCTWGVDRTGAVVGAWRKTVEPELTTDQVLDYTYSFGGQWRMEGDPNRHLRNWLVGIQYDPELKITRYQPNWWILASIGFVSIPFMLLVMKRNKII